MNLHLPAAYNTAALSYNNWRITPQAASALPAEAGVPAGFSAPEPGAIPVPLPVTGGVVPLRTPDGSLPSLTLYDPSGNSKTTYFAPGLGKGESRAEAVEKAMGGEPCEECKNRKYQDGSTDAGVSFKAPGHIAPEASAAVVSAHERQHVTAAFSEAGMKNREVVQANVRLFSATCPECGRRYISGGVTQIRTAAKNNVLSEDFRGQNINKAL